MKPRAVPPSLAQRGTVGEGARITNCESRNRHSPNGENSPPFEHRLALVDERLSGVAVIFAQPRVHVMGGFQIQARSDIGAHRGAIEILFHVTVGHGWTGSEPARQ